MGNSLNNETFMEFYVCESLALLTQLKRTALQEEPENGTLEQLDEMLQLIHSLECSSAVMNYHSIIVITHSLEEVLSCFRERQPRDTDYSLLTDLVLKCIDFIKVEISMIQCQKIEDDDPTYLKSEIAGYLSMLEGNAGKVVQRPDNTNIVSEIGIETRPVQLQYRAVIFFEEGCAMVNIRAFQIIYNLKKSANIINYLPHDILENQNSSKYITEHGFEINFLSVLSYEKAMDNIAAALFIKEVRLELITPKNYERLHKVQMAEEIEQPQNGIKQSMISVSSTKMDHLMELVDELILSQTRVLQNPELDGLPLKSFHKASRQLQLVTDAIRDAVLSLGKISLSTTFQKMTHIVRDMSRKLNKEIRLRVIGEDTEVDKNIVEHISAPLLQLVRNCADHGIEDTAVREKLGKPKVGTITLEAKTVGEDVRIIVRDDGMGLSREEILRRAKQKGMLKKPEQEYTDKEIYSFILQPGFSTMDRITEYSGRGIGMDVVNKSMEEIGGSIQIDSVSGRYTSIMLKIPLTTACR